MDLTANAVERFGGFSIVSGTLCLFIMLHSQGLLHGIFIFIASILALFSIPLIILGGNQDASFAGLSLNFILYLISMIDILGRSIILFIKKLTKDTFVILIGIFVFVTGIYNDILTATGYIGSVMISPLTLAALFLV